MVEPIAKATYLCTGLEVLKDRSARVRLVQLFDRATTHEPVPPQMTVAVLDWPAVQQFVPGEAYEVSFARSKSPAAALNDIRIETARR